MTGVQTCALPISAFKALDARRIGLLTPYAPQINEGLVAYFEGRGVNIAAVATFDRRDDRAAARISMASIEAAAQKLAATPGIDAIFVSCTSLRVAEIVARFEQGAGVAITSSNHAMAWHCLRLAGIDDAMPAAGRLFQRPVA